MKLITQQDLVRDKVAQLRETYAPYLKDRTFFTFMVLRTLPNLKAAEAYVKQVSEKLEALDPDTSTYEEVKAINPGDSWKPLECSECSERVGEAVVLGESLVCRDCIKKASEL